MVVQTTRARALGQILLTVKAEYSVKGRPACSEKDPCDKVKLVFHVKSLICSYMGLESTSVGENRAQS